MHIPTYAVSFLHCLAYANTNAEYRFIHSWENIFFFCFLSPTRRHKHTCKCRDISVKLHVLDLQAFPWQQWGQQGKDETVQQQQMMDGRGDHLFVEQRQRFAVLTFPVSIWATQSTVIDAALCGNVSSTWEFKKMSSLKAHCCLFNNGCY